MGIVMAAARRPLPSPPPWGVPSNYFAPGAGAHIPQIARYDADFLA